LPQLSEAGAVAITSPNAVRHAEPDFLRRIANLPVFAVGEKTGSLARQAGLAVVDAGAGDARRLVQRITDQMPRGTGVLILCGRVRRSVLEDGLAQAGLRPLPVEIYDTLARVPSQGELDAILEGGLVDAALFYSANAAQEFARLLERLPRGEPFTDA